VPSLTVQSLEEDITYEFFITAMNSAGSSSPATHTETTSRAGKHIAF